MCEPSSGYSAARDVAAAGGIAPACPKIWLSVGPRVRSPESLCAEVTRWQARRDAVVHQVILLLENTS